MPRKREDETVSAGMENRMRGGASRKGECDCAKDNKCF